MAKPKTTPTPRSPKQHRRTSVDQNGEVPASPSPPKDGHYSDKAENTGVITRQTVPEQIDALKITRTGKVHSKKKSRPAKKGISTLLNSITGPTPVHAEEALAIEVRIAPLSSDAHRFQASVAEHGTAFLYSSGVDRRPNYCWVQFGLSPVVLETDATLRLDRFACSDLALHWVTKHSAVLKG